MFNIFKMIIKKYWVSLLMKIYLGHEFSCQRFMTGKERGDDWFKRIN